MSKQTPTRTVLNPFKINSLGLQLTNRCNLSCKHCGAISGPNADDGPKDNWLLKLIHFVNDAGISELMITGGEPFLRERTLIKVLRQTNKLGMRTNVTTNGFWGEKADEIIPKLIGLDTLTVSVDAIHSQWIDTEKLLNIAHEISKTEVQLRIYGLKPPHNNDVLVNAMKAICSNSHVYSQDILPVGRASKYLNELNIRGWELSDYDNQPCHVVLFPFIDSCQKYFICSNAALMKSSKLCLGRIGDPSEFQKYFHGHHDNLLFKALKYLGTICFLEMCGKKHDAKRKYVSICDLCANTLFSENMTKDISSLLEDVEFQELITGIEYQLKHEYGYV